MSDWNTPRRGYRFTPAQQAVAVALAHFVILGSVILITELGFHKSPPAAFIWLESGILALFIPLIPTWDVELPFGLSSAPLVRLQTRLRRRSFVAFALTFALQFFALFYLLRDTGGPIDSPFAQLAVAFAVFTAILANAYLTIAFALVVSLLYYGLLVLHYGFGPEVDQPEPIVFFFVTFLIVSLSVGLAVLDRLERERQAKSNAGAEPTQGTA